MTWIGKHVRERAVLHDISILKTANVQLANIGDELGGDESGS